MKKLTYTTIEEKDSLVNDFIIQGYMLKEELNLTEGNYLIFATEEESLDYGKSEMQLLLEKTNNQLIQANADLIVMKLEQAQANAEIIELMMSMLGGV